MADSVLGRRLRHGNDRHDNDYDQHHHNANQQPAAPAAACRWRHVLHVEHLYIRNVESLYLRRDDESIYVRRDDESIYVRRDDESLSIRRHIELLRGHEHGYDVS